MGRLKRSAGKQKEEIAKNKKSLFLTIINSEGDRSIATRTNDPSDVEDLQKVMCVVIYCTKNQICELISENEHNLNKEQAARRKLAWPANFQRYDQNDDA